MSLSPQIAQLMASLFSDLRKHKYVALRFEGISSLQPGEDIDIVCLDKNSLKRKILSALRGNIPAPYYIDVKEGFHVHVDIMRGNVVYLRFDLTDNFDSFKKISVRNFYIKEIIRRSHKAEYSSGETVYSVNICCEEDDLVLRYVEFLEHYEDRPKKIKHYEYVMAKIKEDHNNAQYLKILGQILKPSVISKKSLEVSGRSFVRILQLFLKKIYDALDRFNRLEK